MKKIILLFLYALMPMSVLASDIGNIRGVVTQVEPVRCADGSDNVCQKVQAKTIDGEYVYMDNNVLSPLALEVQEGDRVMLYYDNTMGETSYDITDFDHIWGIWILGFAVIFFVLLIGRWQGVKSLISLGFSLLLIFGVLMPLLLRGYNPVVLTLIICTVVTFATLAILQGFSRRMLIMSLGTMAGVLSATLCAYVFGYFAGMTGLGSEEIRNLAFTYPDLDYRGLLFAGIILGSLGAVMDIAVSITSAMCEICHHSKKSNFKTLWRSGMNMGRDMMGSMMNTLVFAYAGSAYAVIFTFMAIGELSIPEIINLGFVSEEIVRSLVGSLGLIFAIPATVFLNAYLPRCAKCDKK